MFGGPLPSGAAFGARVIEGAVEFAQIPTQALGRVGRWEWNSVSALLRESDERLWRDS